MDFPIEIKVAQIAPRYDETRPRYEQLSETKQTVAVLSLRRNTLLAIVIIVICQLASVDNFNLLPAGILAYVVGAVGTVEAVAYWERQADEEVRQWNDRAALDYERKYNAALFEYHVLRGKPHVQIVTVEENGVPMLFAIH